MDTGKKIQITQKKTGKGKERDRKKRKQVENNKMINLSPNILIITLNVESSKVPIKTEFLGMYVFKWLNYMLSWRRKWQPTPVFLPRELHGQRSPVGYSPWYCKELDMTERLTLYT